jgi:hypothetical protein
MAYIQSTSTSDDSHREGTAIQGRDGIHLINASAFIDYDGARHGPSDATLHCVSRCIEKACDPFGFPTDAMQVEPQIHCMLLNSSMYPDKFTIHPRTLVNG